MNQEFLDAVRDLNATKLEFEHGLIKPVPHANVRGACLARALMALAAEHGVKLQEPLQIDSNGEFSVVAIEPAASPAMRPVTGTFGAPFAEVLNGYSTRTGVNYGAVMEERSGWCRMNHFEVEKMILEQYTKHAPKPAATRP